MVEAKFLRCNRCGNLVAVIDDAHHPMQCCGEEMHLLTANTADGAKEKHVPKVTVEGPHAVVNVGEVDHPMTEEHYIEWVALVTPKSVQVKKFVPGDAPHKKFGICPSCSCEKTMYAYCNLHGLYAVDF